MTQLCVLLAFAAIAAGAALVAALVVREAAPSFVRMLGDDPRLYGIEARPPVDQEPMRFRF